MQLSKSVKKFEAALSELGYILLSATWEPWGRAMEMQGIEGGWFLDVIDPVGTEVYIPFMSNSLAHDFMGLSTDEVLEEIYRHGEEIQQWNDYYETGFFHDKRSDAIRAGRPFTS